MPLTTPPTNTKVGAFSARPAANTVAAGTLYATTDTLVLYGSDGSTWTKISDVGNLPRFGRITTMGHSYTQCAGSKLLLTSGIAVHENFTHRVAAFTNISEGEVYIWGKSGAQAGVANLGDTDQQGTGLAYRFINPDHRIQGVSNSLIATKSKSWPGLSILMYGVNDAGRLGIYGNGTPAIALTAYANGIRAIVSRLMASQLYPTSHTGVFTNFTGFATTVSDSAWTDGSYLKSTTNGDSFTIKVPDEFHGGILSVSLVGGSNVGVAVSAIANNTTTSVTLTDPFSTGYYTFLQNGDVLTVGTEDMAIISGGGTLNLTVTRGVNGTSASSHAAATAFLSQTSARVNWSGTATGATGTTYTAGQGCAGASGKTLIPVVKRFNLTVADAGKTIIGTVAGLSGSNEFVGIDACWIEDPEPNTVLLVNQPYMKYGSAPASFFTRTVGPTYNSALTTVASEFTAGNVAVVDAATPFDALFYGTLQAAITTTNGVTIHVTPSDATQNIINIGSVLKIDTEQMLVTGITKTSNTDWSLTVTRGYNSTVAATHSLAAEVYETSWLSVDLIHPSDEGHVRLAGLIVATLLTVTQSNNQKANAGGLTVRRQPKLSDGAYLPGFPTSRTTTARSTGDLDIFPVYIPEFCLITKLSSEVTSSNASGVLRYGVWTEGGGFPGQLLVEGTALGSSTGERTYTLPAPQPVMPGWYWMGVAIQGAGLTMRSNNGIPYSVTYPFQYLSSGIIASVFGATSGIMAYTITGVTGSLSSYTSVPSTISPRGSNHIICQMVVSVPIRDA